MREKERARKRGRETGIVRKKKRTKEGKSLTRGTEKQIELEENAIYEKVTTNQI